MNVLGGQTSNRSCPKAFTLILSMHPLQNLPENKARQYVTCHFGITLERLLSGNALEKRSLKSVVFILTLTVITICSIGQMTSLNHVIT